MPPVIYLLRSSSFVSHVKTIIISREETDRKKGMENMN